MRGREAGARRESARRAAVAAAIAAARRLDRIVGEPIPARVVSAARAGEGHQDDQRLRDNYSVGAAERSNPI
jgi:hypothetical protein